MAPLHDSCVTSAKLFNLSEPWFSFLSVTGEWWWLYRVAGSIKNAFKKNTENLKKIFLVLKGFWTNKIRCLLKPTGIESDQKDFWVGSGKNRIATKNFELLLECCWWVVILPSSQNQCLLPKNSSCPCPRPPRFQWDNSIKECQSHLQDFPTHSSHPVTHQWWVSPMPCITLALLAAPILLYSHQIPASYTHSRPWIHPSSSCSTTSAIPPKYFSLKYILGAFTCSFLTSCCLSPPLRPTGEYLKSHPNPSMLLIGSTDQNDLCGGQFGIICENAPVRALWANTATSRTRSCKHTQAPEGWCRRKVTRRGTICDSKRLGTTQMSISGELVQWIMKQPHSGILSSC